MKITKRFRITLAVILLAVMPVLNSCSKNENYALMLTDTNNAKYYMSTGTLSFVMSLQKSNYSFLVNENKDWNDKVSDESDMTVAEFVKEQSLDSAKKMIASAYLFDDVYKLKFTNQNKSDVDTVMQGLMNSYGCSDKNSFEELLSGYGTNYNGVKDYFTMLSKNSLLYEYLYGQDGIAKPTEQEKQKYFEDNYAIIYHIYFNMGSKTKQDGTNISLTEEERAYQRTLSEKVYNMLMSGEDFDTLRANYTDDVLGEMKYPQGFFVTDDGTFTQEFQNTALSMKAGEVRVAESKISGTTLGIHIMKREEMDSTLYNLYPDVEEKISSYVASDNYLKLLSAYLDAFSYSDSISELNINYIPEF